MIDHQENKKKKNLKHKLRFQHININKKLILDLKRLMKLKLMVKKEQLIYLQKQQSDNKRMINIKSQSKVFIMIFLVLK